MAELFLTTVRKVPPNTDIFAQCMTMKEQQIIAMAIEIPPKYWGQPYISPRQLNNNNSKNL